jgi:RNA polymerase sigma-32 factor
MSENQNLQIYSMASPIGSIDAYIHQINQVPMLTEEEEQTLARRFHEQQDIEAARKLVMAHLRFVVRVARGYSGYGLPQADLIQEGNIGLMKAVKRFDPNVGVRLVSFAVHWIKAEIHEYILKNWRIVKVATTKAQRKLFFNLRKMKKRLGWLSQDEIRYVAETLDVPTKAVVEMETRLNAFDAAYDSPHQEDDGNKALTYSPAAYLESPNSNPEELLAQSDWEAQRQTKVYAAFELLNEREKDILSQRWLTDKKATLHDLAAKYQISAERVRQLEQNAIKKLRENL